MDNSKAVAQVVAILRPLQHAPTTHDDGYIDRWAADTEVREVVRMALREIGVYDAGGCPLLPVLVTRPPASSTRRRENETPNTGIGA